MIGGAIACEFSDVDEVIAGHRSRPFLKQSADLAHWVN
jgi:hypothetical protein